MDGRVDFHRLFGDVHVAERVELLVHAGQFPLDEVGAAVRHVEVDAAVLGAVARQHLAVDGTRHHIARQQFGGGRLLSLS